MLAALVLEASTVRLRDAAKLSSMRAGSPQPRAMLEIIPAMIGVEVGSGGAVVGEWDPSGCGCWLT